MASYLCFLCKNQEQDVSKIVLCTNCCRCEHLACKGIFGPAAEMLKQKNYFCSLECCEIFKRSAIPVSATDSTSGNDNISKILQAVQNIQLNHANLEAKLDGKLDTLLGEMKAVKADYQSLKEDVEGLHHDQDVLNGTVIGLQLELERINRAALAKNAIILGVPVAKEEVIKQVVMDIASAVDCKLSEDAIVEVKRIPLKDATGNTAPIKVIFAEKSHKEELFMKKKSHGLLLSSALDPKGNGSGGNRIILRDELTSYGMKLLKEVKAVKDQANIRYVWPGRHGVILAKAEEGAKIESIRSMHDVQKLQQSRQKRQLDESLFHSTCIDEPHSKRHQQ